MVSLILPTAKCYAWCWGRGRVICLRVLVLLFSLMFLILLCLKTQIQNILIHILPLIFLQSFPGQSLESEDFNIPPITPPSLPEHSLVHLNDTESGYPSLCHPVNHNGLLPFHPQNMDLPEITVSNMLGQDGTLLSNSLSVVSILYVLSSSKVCFMYSYDSLYLLVSGMHYCSAIHSYSFWKFYMYCPVNLCSHKVSSFILTKILS